LPHDLAERPESGKAYDTAPIDGYQALENLFWNEKLAAFKKQGGRFKDIPESVDGCVCKTLKLSDIRNTRGLIVASTACIVCNCTNSTSTKKGVEHKQRKQNVGNFKVTS
jgi:hypothetical protein